MINITKEHIGREIILGNGNKHQIVGFEQESPSPVVLDSGLRLKIDGCCFDENMPHGSDISGFVDREREAVHITKEDVGREVVLRNGDRDTIVDYVAERWIIPIKLGSGRHYYPDGYEFHVSEREAGMEGNDIMGFVDEKKKQMINITKEDVGREVILRNGDRDTIEGFDAREFYPVKLGSKSLCQSAGYWFAGRDSDLDIIGFVDEKRPESTDPLSLSATSQKVIDTLNAAIDTAIENNDMELMLENWRLLRQVEKEMGE